MSNMPLLEKGYLGAVLRLDLIARVRHYSIEHKETMTDAQAIILDRGLDEMGVELDADDLAWMALEKRRNEMKRHNKAAKRAAKKGAK